MKGKRVLITGSGSGFGELAAIGLAKQGHDVIAGVPAIGWAANRD